MGEATSRILTAVFIVVALALGCVVGAPAVESPWLTYQRGEGPGAGKHIVFVTGDEKYRSEESMPAMARILAKHHGFQCTVLFAIDPKSGTIDPKVGGHGADGGIRGLCELRPTGDRRTHRDPCLQL